MPREALEARLSGLPAGVSVEPGRIEVRFRSAQDAVGRLFALAPAPRMLELPIATRAVRCWMARRSSAVVILRPSHASTRLAVNDAVDLCLESVNALVEKRCAKVDRWQSSSHRHRWLATALLDIEPRLRRVRGYRHLPTLRAALKRELKIDTTTSKKQAASAIWSRGEFQLRMGLTHCLHRQARHRYGPRPIEFTGSNT